MKHAVKKQLLFLTLVFGLGLLAFTVPAFAQRCPGQGQYGCCSAPTDSSGCQGSYPVCSGSQCVNPAFAQSLSASESGHRYDCQINASTALGRFQFLDGTRTSTAQSCGGGGLPQVSRAQFAGCPALQDAYFTQLMNREWATINRNCGSAIQSSGKTQACLLAVAHLKGAGGLCSWLQSGADGNLGGTSAACYCQKHGSAGNVFTGPPTNGTCPTFPAGGPRNTANCAPIQPCQGSACPPAPPPLPPGVPGPTFPPAPPVPPGPTGPFIPPGPGSDNPPCQNGGPSCVKCTCSAAESRATMGYIRTLHNITREFITQQFMFHQNWLFGANNFYNNGVRDSFWELHVKLGMMMMAEQLVSSGMNQMMILGSFFDAKLQLEAQRLFQKKVAEAHRDYHPTYEMCAVGTTARGLASADRNGEFSGFVLSQRTQDREISMYGNASGGADYDRESRIRQVKTRYCDPEDNDKKLTKLCQNSAPRETINRDVDYTRTIDQERTLNIDMTDTNATADEQDVLALMSNLFSHDILDKPKRTPGDMEAAEGAYLEMRGLIAKRNVAENSINAIVGLKTAGTRESEDTIMFTQKVMEQLGVTDENDRLILLGGLQDDRRQAAKRPSYYAQLEVLAQKLYLDPEFYTSLYDKPANVARKDVALQAINLMLERDMHKSELRSEMVYSVWLELELMRYQADVQNRLNALEEKYQEN